MRQYVVARHLAVDGTVATRGQGDLAAGLDYYLACVVQGGDAALREEYYGGGVVAEIVVLLEIADYLLVVHLAGHYVPFYHVCFV